MLKAEWGLIEFVRISAPSDANLSFHISPSASVAWHSYHPPNPHFVTLPILISFSYVFLSVFLNFTFTIFPKAYFSVELSICTVRLAPDYFRDSVASGRKKPCINIFGEGYHQTKQYCGDAAICCALAASKLIVRLFHRCEA